MHNKQNLIKPIGATLIFASSVLSNMAHANLPTYPILDFTSGVNECLLGGTYPTCTYGISTVKTGSYFAMDLSNPGFDPGERVAIRTAGTGVTLYEAQAAGAIDLDWSFASNQGRHLTLNPLTYTSTGTATYDINMAGWTVNWASEGNIDMGQGADATLTCGTDCTAGDTFTLQYTAVVPTGSFTGVNYLLSLTGVIGEFIPPNNAPTTGNVSISALAADDHSWTPDVNDTDGDTLSCSISSQPNNGLATVQADCSSGLYTPSAGIAFEGSDSFTYSANDGLEDSTPGTVNVNISGNPAPLCQNLTNLDGSTTAAGIATTVTIDVTDASICTDENGNNTIVSSTLAVSSASAAGGSVTVDSATGVANYTPPTGFSGTDTFTYTVQDDNGGTSSPATVSLTIQSSSAGSPTTSDGTLSCGATAESAGSSSCEVAMENIGVEDNGFGKEQSLSQTCVGGCFDFEVSGLTTGSQAQIILPLRAAIPETTSSNQGHRVVYRKLMSTGWRNFDQTTDAIASAAGTASGNDFICPPASDASYINGLTPGDRCIRLTITDGGPNDADGTANGTVVDPGGVAETYFTSGTDGCSMSKTPVNASKRADWWLVTGFISLMGLLTLKRRKA